VEAFWLQCRNCGDPVDPRRVELGFDYCLKEECQQRCLRRVTLASVAVNKAADYITAADEVARPPGPAEPSAIEGDDLVAVRPRTRAPSPRKRAKSTLERLQDAEAQLDIALSQSYERFRRGEVTAKVMNEERTALIRQFNQRVLGENIRYRSMLRRLP
jgi:hypothetical protein